MNFLTLPERTQGERLYGITSTVDFGTPVGELKNILNDYHAYVDFAKIGIGSAYVTPNIEEKLEVYKSYGVSPYFGGTFFEKCYTQNKIVEYVDYLKKLGVEWIEISNGTVDIPLSERIALVEELKDDFQVLAEVGSKDPSHEMALSQWEEEIQAFIEAGCGYVVTEGRESGTSGIYHRNGEIKSDLILQVTKNIDTKKIVFEATNPKHQMYFINHFGANVNLANVRISDCLLLESQRRSLRSETFFNGAQTETLGEASV